nr:MAG TPA: hypothetical protein [Caudoviricetes sp.]
MCCLLSCCDYSIIRLFRIVNPFFNIFYLFRIISNPTYYISKFTPRRRPAMGHFALLH